MPPGDSQAVAGLQHSPRVARRAGFFVFDVTLFHWVAIAGLFVDLGRRLAPDNLSAMAALQVSHALLQFVEDEMLRAPLLFDQLVDGAIEHARSALPGMSPLQRSAVAALMEALPKHQARLNDYFMRSLREQVTSDLRQAAPQETARPAKAQTLALVDEEEVALDVQLSHTIEAIKSVAEYELRELQTFTSALVGDMDMARDHNPFRAETFARALWAASQALPMSRGLQVSFMRFASTPLAQLLRKTYAASTSRLEAMGVEPAAYRTLILPAGSRRGRSGESTFAPDLYRMRETMPVPLEGLPETPIYYQGQSAAAAVGRPLTPGVAASRLGGLPPPREHWSDIARQTTQRADRQAIELVSRLFDAMQQDDRMPQDVALLISRLHGPAMRLALRDASLLDKGEHPLWRFVNRLGFAAEMSPDFSDPERQQLLKVAQGTIDQLASEPEQNTGLYRWAVERLENFLNKRLTRRLASLASQVGALQKLEDKLSTGTGVPSTMHGTLDVPELDTVPANLMDEHPTMPDAPAMAEDWLERLQPGDWVRMFLQGRWVQAQALWPGERREIWLFGDGGSDATWAVRRAALLTLHSKALLKTLKQRSIVAAAATRVQEQVAAPKPA